MKIAQKSKFPKKTIITVVALLIIGGAGAFGLYQSQQANRTNSSADSPIRPQNTVDYNPPSTEEQQQKEDTKQDILDKNDTTGNPTTDPSISIVISRANQGGAGLPLNIRTIINGATNGTCTVHLTRTGQTTITKTFPIIVQATYSTCQQADIAAADFPADGEWALSVTAATGNSTSEPATTNVTIAK